MIVLLFVFQTLEFGRVKETWKRLKKTFHLRTQVYVIVDSY